MGANRAIYQALCLLILALSVISTQSDGINKLNLSGNKNQSETDKKISQKLNDLVSLPLQLFHFNDVYDLLPTLVEPKQGVAYFKSLLNRYRFQKTYGNYNLSQYSLTLFAGDVFAPSLLSNQYRGWNMVEPLNSLDIDVACFGNHEFDYSQAQLIKLTKATKFPWLGTNIYNKTTNQIVAGGKQYRIFFRSGYKIGIFTAVQEECLHLFIPEYIQNIEIRPFIEMSRKTVDKLKNIEKCDFIIALTHMMKENDRILAREVQGIDLILGGHDHSILHEQVGDTVIVKSGTDFQHFTKIQVIRNQHLTDEETELHELPAEKKFGFYTSKAFVKCTLVQVNHSKMKIVPDQALHKYVTNLYEQFRQKQGKIVIYTKNDLDLRFQVIRTTYSPYLHFVSELFRHDRGADCALINSGGFREEAMVKAGPITLGSLMNFIKDDIVVKKVPGNVLVQALQNSVSQYPKVSGRYLQFSKVQFTWDCSREPMDRILKDTIRINGQPVIMDKIYTVAFRGYIGEGGDGYLMIRQCPYVAEIPFKQKFLIFNSLIELDQHILANQELRSQINIIEVDGKKFAELDIRQRAGQQKVKMINSAVS